MLAMLFSRFFHNWERRFAASTKDRVIRPFEWGLDWLGVPGGANLNGGSLAAFQQCDDSAMADSAAFYRTTPTPAYELDADNVLRFDSAIVTPHAANNVVQARYFPAEIRHEKPGGRKRDDRRAAVVLLPQWNSDAGGHIGLARLLARFGMSGLRL